MAEHTGNETLYKDVSSLEIFAYKSNNEDFDKGVMFVLEKLDALPVAEVTPVVHGRWIANRICSVCRKGLTEWAAQNSYYYCPHCGAKMDKE